jgi:ferritin-like metal-binding protein YciE
MPTRRKSTTRRQKQPQSGSELLTLELQQIHSAESQLARALPRFAKAVESNALRRMLQERLKQGERLIEEVDSALDELDGSSRGGDNVAATGLINDARAHIQQMQPGPALDSVITAGLQKTEHYCIAAWGTAKALAQAGGHRDAARAMDRALKEGKRLDQQLTRIAERELTPALLSEEMDAEEEEESVSRGRRRSRRGRRKH